MIVEPFFPLVINIIKHKFNIMVVFEWYEITLFLFLVIYLIVTLTLAMLFLKKYLEVKKIEFLYIGLLVFIFSLANTIQWISSFFLVAFTGQPLNPTLMYSIQGFSVLSLIFGFLFFHKLILISKFKKNIATTLLIMIVLFISVIYYIALFIDYSLIGTLDAKGWTALTWTSLSNILFTIANILFFVTFLLFILQALRTPEKRIKLKGKLLLIASMLLAISVSSAFALDFFHGAVYWLMTFLLIHTPRIVGFIFFYIGFTLPSSIERIFLKEN
ncbi:MAG: hypothetical protein GF317_14355 [Candidatus Lokiarchaeota archaeon]|nr:hypothetical protein [Candidatus Lokiarchaeota archaeon]MBD3200788.1 hypothetical protein [Candidatus Lokiarchaeota archaeon]